MDEQRLQKVFETRIRRVLSKWREVRPRGWPPPLTLDEMRALEEGTLQRILLRLPNLGPAAVEFILTTLRSGDEARMTALFGEAVPAKKGTAAKIEQLVLQLQKEVQELRAEIADIKVELRLLQGMIQRSDQSDVA